MVELTPSWVENPLNKLKLQKAFRAKAPQVTLLSGQVFNIVYYIENKRRKAVVRPTEQNGFSPYIPMGRFDINTCLHSDWLS